MAYIGGIDLGASNLRAAIAEVAGEPLALRRARTPDGDGDTVARAAADALETVADDAGVQLGSLEAVGVGTVGPLDRAAGTVLRPPNLIGVRRIPLRDVLADRVGFGEIRLENDAVAGLVGELEATSDPPDDLVYLTLSTGIGAGVAVDGHVLRGRQGNAAEVGHLVVDPTGRRCCGCGHPGHWEAYCSGRAIPDYARDLADETGLETSLAIGDTRLTAADVFAAAGGDPLADHVVDCIVRHNAIGVADLIHAYAPDRLAIGGAVALENWSAIIEPLEATVADHTMLSVPAIRPATYGRDAVLRGALALAADGDQWTETG